MKGIGLSALGYALFSVQDATVKWLVTDYPVVEILFCRSLVIISIAAIIGRGRVLSGVVHSRNKGSLVLRSALILLAWLSFYTAASKMGLAELTTLYFAAPIIAVVLSALILKERVDAPRWIAVLGGFLGVVVAADPSGRTNLLPVLMALFAACCWGFSVILVRLISRSESTANQMLITNGLFALACGIALFWSWRTPDPFSLCLMLGLGLAGGMGQYVLYEGFRYAPASVVAPIEYTGLIWAFLNGYLIWGETPTRQVYLGAGLIVLSSLTLIWFEGRRHAGAAAEP